MSVSPEVADNCFYRAVMDTCAILGRTLAEYAHRKLCKLIQNQKAGNTFLTDHFDKLSGLLVSIGPLEIAWGGRILEARQDDLLVFIRPALCEGNRKLPQVRQYHAVLGYFGELEEQLKNHKLILVIRFRNH